MMSVPKVVFVVWCVFVLYCGTVCGTLRTLQDHRDYKDPFDVEESVLLQVNNATLKGEAVPLEKVLDAHKEFEDHLRFIMGAVVKEAMAHLLQSSQEAKVSDSCSAAVLRTVLGLKNLEAWAYRVFDSMGRPSSGSLSGTVVDFGAYDECLDISVPDRYDPEVEEFRGQYCFSELEMQLPPLPSQEDFLRNPKLFKNETMTKHVAELLKSFPILSMRAALCVPSECTRDDVMKVVVHATKNIGMIPTRLHCEVKEKAVTLSSAQRVIIGIFSIMTLFVMVATLVDRMKFEPEEKPQHVGANHKGYLLALEVMNINFKKPSKYIRYYFLHVIYRFLRFTPTTMAAVGLFFLFPLFTDGPMFREKFDVEFAKCQNHWWAILTQWNNFLQYENACLQYTWYFNADLQIYALTVAFVILLTKRPRLGICLGLMLWIGSLTAVGIQTYIGVYTPTLLLDTRIVPEIYRAFGNIVVRPYTHVGSMITGVFLYTLVQKFKDTPIERRFQVMGWLFTAVTHFALMYGTYGWLGGELPGRTTSALYAACLRSVWAINVSWVVFACITGHGGIVNAFLSWEPFVPFSKLSACTYLIHVLTMSYRSWSIRERIYGHHFVFLTEFMANLVVSFFLGYLLHLIVEAPITNLSKMLLYRLLYKADSNRNNSIEPQQTEACSNLHRKTDSLTDNSAKSTPSLDDNDSKNGNTIDRNFRKRVATSAKISKSLPNVFN